MTWDKWDDAKKYLSAAMETTNTTSWLRPTLFTPRSRAPLRTPTESERAVLCWADKIRSETFLGQSAEQLGMLKEMWAFFNPNDIFARPSESWLAIGFQGDDPIRDVR